MKQPSFRFVNYGFTLLELLAVAAIVVVFAAFAIPGYSNYITQTRANALWSQAEEAKLAVQSMYLKQNVLPSSITVLAGAADYTTSNIDFVKCVDIQAGVIGVLGDPAKFNDLYIWVSWQPTITLGQLTWSCTYSTEAIPYISNIANTCTACDNSVNACPDPFATDPGCA